MMMWVGLHCRLVGRGGRLLWCDFLDYVQKHERVWLCRRIDIARHWHEHHQQLLDKALNGISNNSK